MRSFNMASMPRNPYLGGSASSPFGGGGGINMIGNGGMGTIGDTSHLRATNHWKGRDAQKARDQKAKDFKFWDEQRDPADFPGGAGGPGAPPAPQGPPAPPKPPGPANNPFSGGRPDPDGWTEDDFNKADQRGWTPEQDPNSIEARYEFERREREANGGKTRYQRDQAAGGGGPPPVVSGIMRPDGNPYMNAETSALGTSGGSFRRPPRTGGPPTTGFMRKGW